MSTSETGRLPMRGNAYCSRLGSPGLRLAGAAPPALLLLDHAPGGVGEGGHARGAAALGQWVAARAGELAVGKGLLAGLGERDERDGAESELAAAAADNEALDPASGFGGLSEEIQAVAVGASAASTASCGLFSTPTGVRIARGM